MVAIDTNIIVRVFIRDNESLAKEADLFLKNAKNNSLLIDRLIFAEITYVLKAVYKIDRSKIHRVCAALLNDERFFIPDRSLVDQTVCLFGEKSSLSFEDCWLAALKQTNTVSKIATLDRALLKNVL